ncbi:PilZ domain-containing protein [Bradyrhizobium sediminis]|uniref:PilZ domain-containing protein n=1 Tax=Bradyrhizobium sediminis TaxID=2840469 RepID=A0A975NAU0_9BRAD|nr:PilZ domain-containing protein [Bradyrhizobium sediminis]QWG11186.1 PilZ domain-containing protein [Bradyrhizobium sediminis]QWG20663.1 PilZ domain-containing protein [Bradyrhizobium sediminis]
MAAAAKKRETRKSIRQPGWITLEGGFAARPCVVQDMSSTGAKITIDDPNMLPAKLRLAFSRDARTGRNCEVVWRRGKTVGIKFVR